MKYPDLFERFIRYVKVDTQSNENSNDFPSTPTQLDFARLLQQELAAINIKDATVTQWGYVLATIESNTKKKLPVIGLIAHCDTSPEVSGKNVNPIVNHHYNGRDIVLNPTQKILLTVSDNPNLREKIGQTVITSDGTTLLGADNKAGIAEIMTAVNHLIQHPEIPRPSIRILFTPDEEVGRGTLHITPKEIGATYAYTIDGGKLGELEDETFCADSVEILIKGKNVHPGYAKNKMVNAIKIASDVILHFPAKKLSPETTDKRQGYIHPYHLTGGVEEATIKILIRDFKETGLKEKEEFISQIISKMKTKYPTSSIEMIIKESYRNMKSILDQWPQVTEKAIKALKLAGVKPIKSIVRGGTDGARLSYMGLPTPNLFTGGHNFHSKYEWICLEDMEKAVDVIINLMKVWSQ